MPVRIGANPIGWSNDDMQEIGGDTPLETCLAEAREAGFVGMELGHKFPRDAPALKAALAPFNMACIGGWHSIDLLLASARDEFARAKPHRDLLRAMGTNVFIVAETSNAIHGARHIPLSRRPVLPETQWRSYGTSLTELADRLDEEGFALCYHPHMGTIVQTPSEVDALMAHTGRSVNLLFDTGHATWGGDDAPALAARHASRIGHVHVKDVRAAVMQQAGLEDWSFLDAVLGQGEALGVYTVPGDGMVDYAAVFRALPHYSGWVVVEAEQDPRKANSLTYAKAGVAHVRAALAAAGLHI